MRRAERLIERTLLLCALASVGTTIGIVLVLAVETFGFLRQVPLAEFLFGTEWTPLSVNPRFGVLPLVAGTVLVSAIAMLVALPAGLLGAVYLSEYAPERVRRAVKPILEMLAGVPTVVYGYFALLVVTPLLQRFIPNLAGFNALGPGIVMGIMILPLVSSLSEDALRAVPRGLREGSYALGATRMETSLRVVVPAAFSGITAACILAASRAIGETMIVAIAAGQQPRLTWDPTVPIETMTAYIVQVGLGDTPQGTLAYRTIFAVGTLLFLGTLLLNAAGVRLRARFREEVLMLARAHAGDAPAVRVHGAVRRWLDRLFQAVALLVLVLALAALGALLAEVWIDGASRLSWEFVTGFPSRRASDAGIWHALTGSIVVILATAVLAVPVGVAAAIYLEEYGPKTPLARLVEINIANLAAVPSIVYGLLGLGLFVRSLGMGRSVLAGASTLALLVLPVVILSTREALRAVPRTIREGSYALGATKWQTVRHQVLPVAAPEILTGLILALSRAIGETAPLIAIGALTFVPFAPGGIWSPFTVLPIQIFNWVSRPQPEFRENAAAGILVLLALLLAMNAAAVWLRDRCRTRDLA